MERRTWAHQASGAGQRRKVGPCDQQVAMACGWGSRQRVVTKKVLLQRHRVQIGEGISGPPKERLEPEELQQILHHHPAPYPGDQRQHPHNREGQEPRDQREHAKEGCYAEDRTGGTVSRDDTYCRRRTALEASLSRMEVAESDSGTAMRTSISTTTSQDTGGSAASTAGKLLASSAKAWEGGEEADDTGGTGRGGAAAITAEKRECPPSEGSGDDEELNGSGGGGSDGDVAVPATTTAGTTGTVSGFAGDGTAALSVAPGAKGIVSGSRPLRAVVPGKMAVTKSMVEPGPAVVIAPTAVVAYPRGDGEEVRKDDVILEVGTTEAGDAVYAFNKSAPARRGKWSRLEEDYANRIISDFDEGVLDAAAGVSLRTLLASKLHCDVMRVSKKFKGWACVGKRSFRPVYHLDGRTARAKGALFKMEQAWLRSITAGSNSRIHHGTVTPRRKHTREPPPPQTAGGRVQCQPFGLQRQGASSEDKRGGGGSGDPGHRMMPLHPQQQQQRQRSWLAVNGSSTANGDLVRVRSLEGQVTRGQEEPWTSGASPASHPSSCHVRPPAWLPTSGSSAVDQGGVGRDGRDLWAQYRLEGPATASRPSSAPQVSSCHFEGGATLGEQPTVTRLGPSWGVRDRGGSNGLLSPWPRGHAAGLLGGGSDSGGVDGDRDGDLYPVYTKRTRARSDESAVAELQRQHAGGGGGGIRMIINDNPAVGAAASTARESQQYFPSRLAPLASSLPKYQRFSEGCDSRFAAEGKGFLPAMQQQQQQQQQHPAKFRRMTGCFSRDSNRGVRRRAGDGGGRQDTYPDQQQRPTTSQDHHRRQQWQQRRQEQWPTPPAQAYREETATLTTNGSGHRSVLPGRPLLRPPLEPRSARPQTVCPSFPSARPPPIASFPFTGPSGIGNVGSNGRQGATEEACPARTSLQPPALSYSEVHSPGAGLPRPRSFPPHSHFRGSSFMLSKPEGHRSGGDGGAVVVAPTSEHRSTVVGPGRTHDDSDDGTSSMNNSSSNSNSNNSNHHSKSAHFAVRSLPALVRRISVGSGGGAWRGVDRN